MTGLSFRKRSVPSQGGLPCPHPQPAVPDRRPRGRAERVLGERLRGAPRAAEPPGSGRLAGAALHGHSQALGVSAPLRAGCPPHSLRSPLQCSPRSECASLATNHPPQPAASHLPRNSRPPREAGCSRPLRLLPQRARSPRPPPCPPPRPPARRKRRGLCPRPGRPGMRGDASRPGGGCRARGGGQREARRPVCSLAGRLMASAGARVERAAGPQVGLPPAGQTHGVG